jgi:AraC-like DNA-binding protein
MYKERDLYRRIVNAKLFIDQHYEGKIDLLAIADEAFFSKYHFIRLFKMIYGKTPHHYLIQIRIDRAKELLAKNISVFEVSDQVGFESPTSFTAVFKKITGKTPSAYQQAHRIKRSRIANNPLSAVPNCFAETSGWTKNSNF